MRILHIISNLSGGGAERQFLYLVSGLADRGHEVHVAYLNGRSFDLGKLPSVHFHRIKARGNYDPAIVFRLIWLVFRLRPDLIQSWILQSDIVAALVSAVTRTKWVLREPNAPFLRRNKGIKFTIRDAVTRMSSVIVANSISGIEYWKSKYPGKTTCMIRNGFPVSEIRHHGSDAAIPFAADGKYVLFVGRLEQQKNIFVLIEAMTHVDTNVRLLICGSGSLEVECRSMIRVHHLDDRVSLLGNVSNKQAYSLMRHAQALVLISHFEGFPNVIIEAMINLCPIIASDIAPHGEFLDETTAILTNKDSAEDVATSIMRVLNDPLSAQERAKRAFEVASKYSVDHMVDNYESLYRSLVSNAVVGW